MVREGYKQTEVGVIPENWEVKAIKELSLDISDGNYSSKYPRSDEFKPVGVPFIRGNNLHNMTVVDDDLRFISCEKHHQLLKGHLKKGDILITTRGDIGQIAFVPDRHIDSNINAQLVRINTGRVGIDNKYFAYFLLKDETQEKIFSLQTGSALKQLPISRLVSLSLALPPLPEQRAIAQTLSDVDALIASLDKLIAKQRHLKTATMQQLLTGKKRLPGFGEGKSYKKTEVGIIPEDWTVSELGEIIRAVRLGGNYKNQDIETAKPLIKMGNLDRGFIVLEKVEYIPNWVPVVEEDRLKFGDLLFNTRNTLDLVGKVAIWRDELGEAYYNSNILRLEFKDGLIGSNFFMNYVLNTKQSIQQLKGFATGTTSVAAIYTRDLYKLCVAFPGKEEQCAIATVLSDMDAAISALQTRRAKTQAIKQGMMQELLTGRTRLV